jgi:hypothetical protein
MNEQQLKLATSRTNHVLSKDEETESLHQTYLALGELLDRQSNEVDQQRLIAAVLQDRPTSSAAYPAARSEAYLAMAALAASLLLMVSLAATQFIGSGQSVASLPNTTTVANNASNANIETDTTVPENDPLAWENDGWEERLEGARDFAAAYRTGSLLQLDATAWSASQVRQELESDLDSL